MQTELLKTPVSGVSINEKKNLLTQHLQTWLGHKRPQQVFSLLYSATSHDVSPLILVPTIRLIQCKHKTIDAMTLYFPNAKAAQALVPCCITNSPDFLLYNCYSERNAWPWFKLGLNNDGSLVVLQKVARNSVNSFFEKKKRHVRSHSHIFINRD